MRILVSNDDGYFAPGIRALVDVLRDFGTVEVVAPERDRSGASSSLTLGRPLTVRQSPDGFWFVDGTPADCVHLALSTLFDKPFDLVVTGVNDGANLGDDTIYSGTVAAAIEGLLAGVPALAFSITRRNSPHLASAAQVARTLMQRVLERPLEPGTLLNVNIPSLPPEQLGPIEVTRLGSRARAQAAEATITPRGHTVYWIGLAGTPSDAGPGTDFHAVEAGRVSVTPIQTDMTAKARLDSTRQWLPAGT